MQKLKPCPFCGEKDNLSIRKWSGWNNHFVRCESCFAIVPDPSATDFTKKEAIEAWNRRVDDDTERKID